jgi:putative addiction module component (TIGR02574 family)
MGKVEHLQEQVQTLTPEEMAQFRTWFLDLDWATWDAELEHDVASGRLDPMADQATRDLASSRTTNILCTLVTLPPGDRIDIAQALWDSLHRSEIDALCPLTTEQIAEIERRLKDDVNNPDELIPWEEARRQIWEAAGLTPE